MRQQGRVYMRQAGTSGEWKDVGSATGCSVALEVNEPVKPILTGGFTFSTKSWDPEVLKLYYGADFVKFAGEARPQEWIEGMVPSCQETFARFYGKANNRGETRKEEKHMGVRKFTSMYGKSIVVSDSFGDADLEVGGRGSAIIKHADVPLIAHALFEKSGWPGAEQDDDGDYEVIVDRKTAFGMAVEDQSTANLALARAIANLAAYNAWHEGKAKREAAEAAKKAEAEAAAAKKREHDELRTSPIALEALKIYNNSYFAYESWDAVNNGEGVGDETVRDYIKAAEAARAAKPAPKVGDRVRVSADAKTTSGAPVYFDGEIEGVVVGSLGDNIEVKAPTTRWPGGIGQSVDPKHVTVLATAEEVAAEKAKAERDAGIVDLSCVMGISRRDAEVYYNLGIRATA